MLRVPIRLWRSGSEVSQHELLEYAQLNKNNEKLKKLRAIPEVDSWFF